MRTLPFKSVLSNFKELLLCVFGNKLKIQFIFITIYNFIVFFDIIYEFYCIILVNFYFFL